jgi:hypothetical protein
MRFNPSSCFVGIATVLATIAVGFGGGVMMTDVLVGNSDKPSGFSERRPPEAKRSLAASPVAAPNSQASLAATDVPQATPRPAAAPQATGVTAKAKDADFRKAFAAERTKPDRRKRAERRKRDMKRIQQQHQLAEQGSDVGRRSDGSPAQMLAVEAPSPRTNLFGGD